MNITSEVPIDLLSLALLESNMEWNIINLVWEGVLQAFMFYHKK